MPESYTVTMAYLTVLRYENEKNEYSGKQQFMQMRIIHKCRMIYYPIVCSQCEESYETWFENGQEKLVSSPLFAFLTL